MLMCSDWPAVGLSWRHLMLALLDIWEASRIFSQKLPLWHPTNKTLTCKPNTEVCCSPCPWEVRPCYFMVTTAKADTVIHIHDLK